MAGRYSHRIALSIDYSQDSMTDIKITLPDGSSRTLADGATGYDLAAEIGSGLAKAALVVKIGEAIIDLNTPFDLEFFTW